jgi:hypothetical protein
MGVFGDFVKRLGFSVSFLFMFFEIRCEVLIAANLGKSLGEMFGFFGVSGDLAVVNLEKFRGWPFRDAIHSSAHAPN